MKRHEGKIREGVRHLRRVDPVMRRLIRECPPLTSMRLQSNRFAMLVQSILSQQISVQAARSIRSRLSELTGTEDLKGNQLARFDVEQLRAIGISRPKAAYLLDLADKVQSGKLKLNGIGRLKDEHVIRELTQVKGVGVWTAQMFLIFSLGRLDVFPHEDYGVRSAMQRLYRLNELPKKAAAFEIGERWRPYSTIASWYCWRSHELEHRKSGGV